jgi:hypothetical protein
MSLEKEVAVKPDSSELSPLNSREQALLVTYDFLKHMSTLAIVAVGGMLGLAQGVGAKLTGPILTSIALVGASAFFSLMFMAGVAATQITQRVHKSSNGFALAVVVLVLMMFAAGVGAFLAGFARALGH